MDFVASEIGFDAFAIITGEFSRRTTASLIGSISAVDISITLFIWRDAFARTTSELVGARAVASCFVCSIAAVVMTIAFLNTLQTFTISTTEFSYSLARFDLFTVELIR